MKLLDPTFEKREAFVRMAQDWLDHVASCASRTGRERPRPSRAGRSRGVPRETRSISGRGSHHPGWVPGTEFWLEDDAGEIDLSR
jgi:hypothetical protein